MSAFKQKIMAVAAFEIDTLDMLDVTCKAFPMSFHKRERKDAEFVYKRAFAAANLRLTPLLTRLVDDVEALKAALSGIIEIGKRDMTNPKYDGYFTSAKEVIETHQKRWEDLK